MAIYILHKVPESPAFHTMKTHGQLTSQPLAKVVCYPLTLICCVLLLFLDGILRVLFVPLGMFYVSKPQGFTYIDLLNALIISGFVMAGTAIISGYLGDVLGRRKVLCASLLLAGFATFPLFSLLDYAQAPDRLWPVPLFMTLL